MTLELVFILLHLALQLAIGVWISGRIRGQLRPEAVPVLSRALSDPEPLVRAHAAWALGRVGSAEARSALSVAVETDACVLEELSAAMQA